MIAYCLLCESIIKTYDTPMGVEAVCSSCYEPVEDAGEVATMRGIGEDKRDAVEDLYRVQNEYLETNAMVLMANMFEDLETQVTLESSRQTFDNVSYIIGPREVRCPRTALELAKWAAQGK